MIMKHSIYILLAAILVTSCGSKQGDGGSKDEEPTTEVETTTARQGSIGGTIELMATTSYLRHSSVVAPTNAYITGTFTQIGQAVRRGQTLFSLVTKERQALGGDMPGGDLGKLSVSSPQGGVVTGVMQQTGCYVQEGTVLATLADPGSMVFLIDVPYEDMKLVRHGRLCRIVLPDETVLSGVIDTQLASMAESSQSLQVTARARSPYLPEGMNVKVRIDKPGGNARTWLLPRQAVQSDDSMTQFWIMKVGSNGRAVRVNVTTGNSNPEYIEITSPQLNATDRIITTGGYGLQEGAKVKIKR